MTQKAGASGALTLSPRPGNGPPTTPNAVDSRRMLRTSAVSDPAQIAETAQARVFERLLQAERADLEELATRIAHTAEQPVGSDAPEQGHDLAQVRARLVEIRGLLGALRGRFPQSSPDLDR